MIKGLKSLVSAAFVASAMPGAVAAQGLPAALVSDPPQDSGHPAGMIPFALPTHGVKINAALYTAAGVGPHPDGLDETRRYRLCAAA